MCEDCKALIKQIELQRDVLQQLITGMEIMTTNARVQVHMTEPKMVEKGEAA